MSLNLVVGYSGLLSDTHAAFYGVGAYTAAILLTTYGFSFLPALVIAVLVTGVVSFLIGLVLSRFGGDYYALGSFGFNIIVFSIFLNWQSVTSGPLGIPGIPRPEIFGLSFSDNTTFLGLVAVLALLTYLCAQFITSS